jgi:hypothetical protein
MSDLETEKADADCYQLNLPDTSLFLFKKRSELSAIMVANSSSDKVAERDTNK